MILLLAGSIDLITAARKLSKPMEDLEMESFKAAVVRFAVPESLLNTCSGASMHVMGGSMS